MRPTKRGVSWVKSAKKDFEKFPDAVQAEAVGVLTI